MRGSMGLILGEFPRKLDERYRLSLPTEILAAFGSDDTADGILAKERPGCVSLWPAADWQPKLEAGMKLVQAKIEAGRLEGRLEEVQALGRLLSTRHRPVQLTGRGRLLVPEGFREFLKVQPGDEVMIVGAAVCVELWQPAAWLDYLEGRIPRFKKLFDRLTS